MDRICIASLLWLCCQTPEQTERLRRLSSFVLAYEAEEKEYDTLEQLGQRRVSSALADEAGKEEAGCSGAPAQAEKEAECRHAPEKEAECPYHSPEEGAEEEAERPDSPEEEEEAEASS